MKSRPTFVSPSTLLAAALLLLGLALAALLSLLNP